MELQCLVCGESLVGGLDTYGPVGLELCWACWSLCGDEPEWLVAMRYFEGAHYGLAPHIHHYDDQGNLILGATEFLPLPAPDEDGLIVLDGHCFKPDPEAPGLGIWFVRRSDAIKFELALEGLTVYDGL